MSFASESDLPPAAGDLWRLLESLGFWVSEEEHSPYFGDAFATLTRQSVNVRFVRDRGQWRLDVAGPEGAEWFSPSVWRATMEGEVSGTPMASIDEEAEYVATSLDRVLAMLDGAPDLLDKLRQHQAVNRLLVRREHRPPEEMLDAPGLYVGAEQVSPDADAARSVDEVGWAGPDNRYAWCLAAVPLSGVLFEVLDAKGADIPDTAVAGGTVGLAIVLAMRDADALRVINKRIAGGLLLAALLPPVYLIVRSVKVRGAVLVAIAWWVALGIAIASVFVSPVVLGVSIDGQRVEQEIEETLARQMGMSVEADCPDRITKKPGQVFECTARTLDGQVIVYDITVENIRGDLTFRPQS